MFLENVISTYYGEKRCSDRGDLVQTIIIVAVFAVVAIAAIGLIGNMIMSKGKMAADCIVNSGFNTNGSGDVSVKCVERAKAKQECEATEFPGEYYLSWDEASNRCGYIPASEMPRQACESKVQAGWTYAWNETTNKCDFARV